MLFVDDPTWKPNFPPILSDHQWSRIAHYLGLPLEDLGLPLEARYNIDNMVGLYRQQLADAQSNHPNICEKLTVAREAAAEALSRLDDVASDPNAFAAIATGLDGQRTLPPRKVAAFRSWLKRQCKELQALVEGYDNAMQRVHNQKRGPRTGRDSLLTLVSLLNGLHKAYTGKRISRSEKSNNTSLGFVLEICRIANPKLKESTVKEAIKQTITDDLEDDLNGVAGPEDLVPVQQESYTHDLHIETNCSWMPIFFPVPGRTNIHFSKTKEPCKKIRWRVLPRGE
jgi:hypothetical protein